jgi:hypothetical protein
MTFRYQFSGDWFYCNDIFLNILFVILVATVGSKPGPFKW